MSWTGTCPERDISPPGTSKLLERATALAQPELPAVQKRGTYRSSATALSSFTYPRTSPASSHANRALTVSARLGLVAEVSQFLEPLTCCARLVCVEVGRIDMS